MKLYEYEAFPSPRRVRMFLSEKDIDIPRVQVNVPAGEHREPEFLALNPDGVVPVLQLDDNSCISETMAISRYFEELHPTPAMFGSSNKEKAQVEMWQRRVEGGLVGPLAAYFHHATAGLGETERYRNPDWGRNNRKIALQTIERLNRHLADNTFIAGNNFSVADITAYCAIDFAAAMEILIPENSVHLQRWYSDIDRRPSAAA